VAERGGPGTPAAFAADRLATIRYATVATCSPAGQPWNSPVYFALATAPAVGPAVGPAPGPATGPRFFWTSGRDAVHSRNIRANGRAFIVVYDSMVPEGTGGGVYLDCRAAELADPAHLAAAATVLAARVGEPPWPTAAFVSPSPSRLYEAVAIRGWVDQRGTVDGHPVDVRAEIDLAALTAPRL
jgi:Pyridoxamine 5'-phosphate oxidase